ncbi:MAG: cupin domain-containing protein [Hyphomonadaceae bacterium]
MPSTVRRIVTGHDKEGNAVFAQDGAPPRVIDIAGTGTIFHELWHTKSVPARIDRESAEPQEAALTLAPPKGGVRIRIVDLPPEGPEVAALDPAAAKQLFDQFGAGHHSTHKPGGHPFMHRTETLDYGIVLEGEITLILDKGETLCRPGDIIVQNGTNHAWANRSGRPVRMCFVLIDGKFEEGLR